MNSLHGTTIDQALVCREARRRGWNPEAMTVAQIAVCNSDSTCVWCKADYYVTRETWDTRRCPRCGQAEGIRHSTYTLRAWTYDLLDDPCSYISVPWDVKRVRACVLLWPQGSRSLLREETEATAKVVTIRLWAIAPFVATDRPLSRYAVRTHHAAIPATGVDRDYGAATQIGAATQDRALALYNAGHRSVIEVAPGDIRPLRSCIDNRHLAGYVQVYERTENVDLGRPHVEGFP